MLRPKVAWKEMFGKDLFFLINLIRQIQWFSGRVNKHYRRQTDGFAIAYTRMWRIDVWVKRNTDKIFQVLWEVVHGGDMSSVWCGGRLFQARGAATTNNARQPVAECWMSTWVMDNDCSMQWQSGQQARRDKMVPLHTNSGGLVCTACTARVFWRAASDDPLQRCDCDMETSRTAASSTDCRWWRSRTGRPAIMAANTTLQKSSRLCTRPVTSVSSACDDRDHLMDGICRSALKHDDRTWLAWVVIVTSLSM